MLFQLATRDFHVHWISRHDRFDRLQPFEEQKGEVAFDDQETSRKGEGIW